jgi:hypothetical protein
MNTAANLFLDKALTDRSCCPNPPSNHEQGISKISGPGSQSRPAEYLPKVLDGMSGEDNFIYGIGDEMFVVIEKGIVP